MILDANISAKSMDLWLIQSLEVPKIQSRDSGPAKVPGPFGIPDPDPIPSKHPHTTKSWVLKHKNVLHKIQSTSQKTRPTEQKLAERFASKVFFIILTLT